MSKPNQQFCLMRKLRLVFSTVIAFVFSLSFASGQIGNVASFQSTDKEVTLEVQRGTGEVKLHLTINHLLQYDHIIIERSAETPDYFGKCKYISCTDAKTEKGDFKQIDKYPYSATKDVYYRIKTVTKDGVERAYPAVLLASAVQ